MTLSGPRYRTRPGSRSLRIVGIHRAVATTKVASTPTTRTNRTLLSTGLARRGREAAGSGRRGATGKATRRRPRHARERREWGCAGGTGRRERHAGRRWEGEAARRGQAARTWKWRRRATGTASSSTCLTRRGCERARRVSMVMTVGMKAALGFVVLRLTRQALGKAARRHGRRARHAWEGRRRHAGGEVEGRRRKGASGTRAGSTAGNTARSTATLVRRMEVRGQARRRPGGRGLVLWQHRVGVSLALGGVRGGNAVDNGLGLLVTDLLVVVDDVPQVVATAVVSLPHAHRVVRQVDVAVVAEDCG